MQALILKIFRPIGYLDPTWMSSKLYCYLRSRYWGGQYEVMNSSLFEAVKTEISTIALFHFFLYWACSQTLYFLFKVRRARVIKNKKQGRFIDRQRKGVGVGEEENRRSLFFVLARAPCSPMFSKRTKSKKKKTASKNRLFFIRKAIWTKTHPQRSKF